MVYPVITAVITAAVGIILEILGFDFVKFFSEYPKECIFFIIAVIVIVLVVMYDIFKGRLSSSKNDLKEKQKEIQSLKNDLNVTKSKLDEVMKLHPELHYKRALNNYKNDNDKE